MRWWQRLILWLIVFFFVLVMFACFVVVFLPILVLHRQ